MLVVFGGTIFYGYWNPYYIGLPYYLIFVGFIGSRCFSRFSHPFNRKVCLVATLGTLLLPLLFFKYSHFVCEDILGLPRRPEWHVGLPLGISFISFTMIAYLVDVYRGVFPTEAKLNLLSALVLFFPHSIAGPILRPLDLIPQFLRARAFDREEAYWGFALFTLGLVKKILLADQLAQFIQPIFSLGGGSFAPFHQLLGIYAFAIQIYADFSGYTDMALGAALMLGYKLPINFARPYLSTSLIDFWRRWHISLSSWLRDYIYIPMGGNRKGFGRQCIAISITMLISGLWHGAGWTFLVWGIYHSAALIINLWLGRGKIPQLPRFVSIVLTFQVVAFGFIFFRSENFYQALHIFSEALKAFWPLYYPTKMELEAAIFPLALVGLFFATHSWDDHKRLKKALLNTPAPIAGTILVGLWILVYAISHNGASDSSFIYFDF